MTMAGPIPVAALVAALLGGRDYDLPPTPPWAVRVECEIAG